MTESKEKQSSLDFSEMNVYQRLAEVRKSVPYLKKEKSGQQYQYVGSSDVLGALHSKINEVGLQLVPSIVDHKVTEQVENITTFNKYTKQNEDKKRITYFTEIDMVMTWVNIDDPEDTVQCSWYAQGVDIAGEKGVGKALTYGEKYFLLKYFNIATDKDDPDAFQEKMDSKKSGNEPNPNASKNKTQQDQAVQFITEDKQKLAVSMMNKFAAMQNLSVADAINKLFPYLKIKSQLDKLTADDFGILMNYLNKHLSN